MRKILFIECCGEDSMYFEKIMATELGHCKHSEGKPKEVLDKHEMPLWCPLENADKEGE